MEFNTLQFSVLYDIVYDARENACGVELDIIQTIKEVLDKEYLRRVKENAAK